MRFFWRFRLMMRLCYSLMVCALMQKWQRLSS